MKPIAIGFVVCAVWHCVAVRAAASPCEDRCEASYRSCAQLEAAGCELSSTLTGTAAQSLGEQIPIPGLGALFGTVASSVTARECKEHLVPCEKVAETCLAECAGPGGTSASGAGGSAALEIKHSTLRVFSDKPRTIVYFNGERMGATPADPLEPFVSPDLRVGKYWVRLVSQDGLWSWEGAKDIEEGNVNAVEGRLIYTTDRDWEAATSADQRGDAVRALSLFRAFLSTWPGVNDRVSVAMERVAALEPQVDRAEEEMFRRIEREPDPEVRVALCQVYEFEFATWPRVQEVTGIAASAQVDAARTRAVQSRNPEIVQPGTNLLWLRCPLRQEWNGLSCGAAPGDLGSR